MKTYVGKCEKNMKKYAGISEKYDEICGNMWKK